MILVLLTLVSGRCSDIFEYLNKVGQVVAEELGAYDNAFASVIGEKGRAEEFRLAL